MVFYDYICNNLAKGRLFRAGSIDNGNGIVVGWLAAAKSSLRLGEGCMTSLPIVKT